MGVGQMDGGERGKFFGQTTGRIMMEGGGFHQVERHSPKAQEISPDLAMTGAKNLFLHLPERDLLLTGQGLGAAVLFVKVGGQHQLAQRWIKPAVKADSASAGSSCWVKASRRLSRATSVLWRHNRSMEK